MTLTKAESELALSVLSRELRILLKYGADTPRREQLRALVVKLEGKPDGAA